MLKTTPKISGLKAYVPAKDFERSKKFYASLGFILTDGWGGTVDCEMNGYQFRLQDYYVKDWADNFMIVMYVNDAQEWLRHVKSIAETFPEIRIKDPEDVDGFIVLHVVDPTGVLLVFVQRPSMSE